MISPPESPHFTTADQPNLWNIFGKEKKEDEKEGESVELAIGKNPGLCRALQHDFKKENG